MFARQDATPNDPDATLGPPAPLPAPPAVVPPSDLGGVAMPAPATAAAEAVLPTTDQPVATPATIPQAAAEQPITLATAPDEPAATAVPDTPFWSLGDLTGSSGMAGLLMAVGVLILVVMMMNRYRRNRARQADAPSPREQIERIRSQAAERARIDAYKADAEAFTREMAALLDSKAERLEQLIADADERLSRLASAESDAGPARTARGTPPPHREGIFGVGDRPSAADRLRPMDGAATEPAAESDRTSSHFRDDGEDHDPGADPVHARIYRLADEGLSPVQIARQTGRPTGQVELILALRS